jgi:predicted dithiol-disulfide oxidoreductase (DUF899 family)
MTPEIQQLEEKIASLSAELAKLRRQTVEAADVPNYTFQTLYGPTDLRSLFAGKRTLFAIHNMGQGCRYCTLWADGLNAFLPHLEDQFAVVLLSKNTPEEQQRFAHARQWRFRMASHGGGAYSEEQTVLPGTPDMPGMVCYQLDAEDRIIRKNSAIFGPGDLYCSLWHVLGLAGFGEDNWTPQYAYWKRPSAAQMDDGAENLPCCD